VKSTMRNKAWINQLAIYVKRNINWQFETKSQD
jgi:hypothetical protein